ncbi:MAG: hypothetical protein IIA27_05295 [Gemmatimonadetes bacterium]|nr:hypothetical protein [Gemmatimonadota bacterium]
MAALTVSTGGTGLVLLIEAVVATTMGAAGVKLAAAGAAGMLGSIAGCLAACF